MKAYDTGAEECPATGQFGHQMFTIEGLGKTINTVLFLQGSIDQRGNTQTCFIIQMLMNP